MLVLCQPQNYKTNNTYSQDVTIASVLYFNMYITKNTIGKIMQLITKHLLKIPGKDEVVFRDGGNSKKC